MIAQTGLSAVRCMAYAVPKPNRFSDGHPSWNAWLFDFLGTLSCVTDTVYIQKCFIRRDAKKGQGGRSVPPAVRMKAGGTSEITRSDQGRDYASFPD